MSTIACIRAWPALNLNTSYTSGYSTEVFLRRVSAALNEISRSGGLMPVGTIFEWAGDVPPAGSLICDGSELGRGSHAELFRVIGTRYGAGDGSTTFNIPTQEQARQRRPASEVPAQQINGGEVTITNPDGSGETPVPSGGRPSLPPNRPFPNVLP